MFCNLPEALHVLFTAAQNETWFVTAPRVFSAELVMLSLSRQSSPQTNGAPVTQALLALI